MSVTVDKTEKLKEILFSGNVILFLGAGFSLEASNAIGTMPTGEKLKQEIFTSFIEPTLKDEFKEEVLGYNLREICTYVNETLKKQNDLKEFLINRFKRVKPKEFHYSMLKYPWKKIYGVNIDDLVENVYSKSDQKLVVQNKKQQKNVGDALEYIKIHGCVNEPDMPMVFSEREYTNLIQDMNFKVNDLTIDIHNRNFIFVGANLDEPDIDYYVNLYEKAGYSRKGTLIFINPKATIKAKTRIENLGGLMLEWTAKEFFEFIKLLDYNPTEIEKSKNRLNYSGIFLYQDIINSLSKTKVYESKLYRGYECKWEDIAEEWTFETPNFKRIIAELDSLEIEEGKSYCYSIYGKRLVGKGCLLKQIGSYLNKRNYVVLEHKGKVLDTSELIDFMESRVERDFVLLIENASYYYPIIEKLQLENFGVNRLLIITTSREYYHCKKKYYLEDTDFVEKYIDDKLTKEYAEMIYKKISEKGYTRSLPLDSKDAVHIILKYTLMSNFLSNLLYDDGFKERIKNLIEKNFDENQEITKLLFELTIFDKADLPYYPSEMVTERYNLNFIYKEKENVLSEESEEALFTDFVRIDADGLSLKNQILQNQILQKRIDKTSLIVNLLKFVSKFVSENKNNYWRVIFESLLKEDYLQKTLNMNLDEILDCYYQLKKEYSGISYYWLQIGIAEQKKRDYPSALVHLERALKIRPYAYQIQHAVARNYLKQANNSEDIKKASILFSSGERKMLELINSKNKNKAKAREFSIHCYMVEKIKFMSQHKINVTKKDICDMKKYIDMVIEKDDDRIREMLIYFMKFVKENDKLEYIEMNINDRYFWALNQAEKSIFTFNTEMEDVLIESY